MRCAERGLTAPELFRHVTRRAAKPTFPYERGRGTAAPAGLKAAVEEVVVINVFKQKMARCM